MPAAELNAATLLLALGLAACRHNEPPKPGSVVVPVAAVTTPAVVDAGAMSPTSPPAFAVVGSKTRTGAPGDTKGTVSCGATRCKVGAEACVERDDPWSCVPLDKVPTADRSYECDDVADCTENGNDVCCSGDLRSAMCATDTPVDSPPCAFAACNTDPGAPSCPKGQSCTDGICRPPPPRATCAGKKPCPADRPLCLWSNGTGTCATPIVLAGPDVAAYECTRPSDCGAGFTCCAPVGDDLPSTRCQAHCGQDAQVVCEKSADCPPFYATGANSGLVPQTCKKRATSGLPAWAGSCQ